MNIHRKLANVISAMNVGKLNNLTMIKTFVGTGA
jgi:hypothetical protein